VFGRKLPSQKRLTSDANHLIRLVAFVKEKIPGDDNFLKLRWMKFQWLSFPIQAKQPGMLTNS
jgi:hypothetical protein